MRAFRRPRKRVKIPHGPATVRGTNAPSLVDGPRINPKKGKTRCPRGGDARIAGSPARGPSCPGMGFFMRHRFLCLHALLLFLGGPAVAAPRWISLLPSHTEILTLLGALDEVVAVSDAEDPRVLPRLPRVGGMDLAWETLTALKPTLVLADASHRRHAAAFERFGIPVVFLPSTTARTVEDVLGLVEEVGRLTGRDEAAAAWRRRAKSRIKTLDARRRGPGRRVYFEIWPNPLQGCGPRSLPGHLLGRAGAVNVVPAAGADMPLVSAEAVVAADPEVVLHTGVQSTAEFLARPGWERTTAVRTRRIVVVDADLLSRAGPRVLEAWELLLKVLE